MICPDCATFRGVSIEIWMHRTGGELITYCPECGREERIQRDIKREKWTEEERKKQKVRSK